MARTIKVHRLGRTGDMEIKEVSLEEAERILKETYDDSLGGFVADRKTGQIIFTIKPNVEEIEEIIVIPEMLGGG